VAACNVGESALDLTLPVSGFLAYASADGAELTGADLCLPADTTVLVRSST
jgi:hypothetical protein